MKKHNWKLDTLLTTLFVFIFTGVLGLIAVNLKIFDPFERAFKDFDFANIYYSKIRKNQNITDTNIVIVNCGKLQRDSIALMLSAINRQKPKVIGIDLYFACRKDPRSDSLLKSALGGLDKAVFINMVRDSNGSVDKVVCSDPYFGKFNEGYSNFIGKDNATATIHSFMPFIKTDKKTYPSFASVVVGFVDSSSYRNLLYRGNKTEIIHYIGNQNSFICLDVKDIFQSASCLHILKNKIVLIGYMGESFSAVPDLKDYHFTPMNREISGRASPDMYGILIHANIISMILHGDYINIAPTWLSWFISIVLCYFHIAFFIYMYVKRHKWFNFTGRLLQFVSSVLLIWISFLCYEHFNYKFSVVLVIANILLAMDLLYFYEWLMIMVTKKWKIKSVFVKKH